MPKHQHHTGREGSVIMGGIRLASSKRHRKRVGDDLSSEGDMECLRWTKQRAKGKTTRYMEKLPRKHGGYVGNDRIYMVLSGSG